MPTQRETILSALHTLLQTLPATALRGEVLPERVPTAGLLILRDGEPGEPEVTLSPLRYAARQAATDLGTAAVQPLASWQALKADGLTEAVTAAGKAAGTAKAAIVESLATVSGALAGYAKEAKDVGAQIGASLVSAFRGAEDAFVTSQTVAFMTELAQHLRIAQGNRFPIDHALHAHPGDRFEIVRLGQGEAARLGTADNGLRQRMFGAALQARRQSWRPSSWAISTSASRVPRSRGNT